jgi:hypothetical protein
MQHTHINARHLQGAPDVTLQKSGLMQRSVEFHPWPSHLFLPKRMAQPQHEPISEQFSLAKCPFRYAAIDCTRGWVTMANKEQRFKRVCAGEAAKLNRKAAEPAAAAVGMREFNDLALARAIVN